MYCPNCGSEIKRTKPLIHPKFGSSLVYLDCSNCGESYRISLNETREQLAKRLGLDTKGRRKE